MSGNTLTGSVYVPPDNRLEVTINGLAQNGIDVLTPGRAVQSFYSLNPGKNKVVLAIVGGSQPIRKTMSIE